MRRFHSVMLWGAVLSVSEMLGGCDVPTHQESPSEPTTETQDTAIDSSTDSFSLDVSYPLDDSGEPAVCDELFDEQATDGFGTHVPNGD